MTPYHRSLVNGCEECPLSDLKTAFREVDNRQDALLEMETALAACISDVQSTGGSSRSILPCIFRRTFELLDMMPKLSKVIKCQLSREQCYDSSDIMNSHFSLYNCQLVADNEQVSMLSYLLRS